MAGVAEGCRQAGCALVGGEMAEMPGLYSPGEFDLAGFCVGLAERAKLIDGSTVQEGDVVLGLASSGFHSNGYSLVRKVLEVNKVGPGQHLPRHDRDRGRRRCCAPTRIYVKSILRLLDEGVPVKSMAHITGGGMIGNFSRVVPDGHVRAAALRRMDGSRRCSAPSRTWAASPSWRCSPPSTWGSATCWWCPQDEVARARELLAAAGEQVFELGTVVAGPDKVTLQGVS